MKRILSFVAIAAMVCFVSCKKSGTNEGGEGGNEEQKYEAPITIDGNFDDWAKLDASKVQVFQSAANHPKPDMKLMKVYADKYYVFVYVEFDFSAYDGQVDMAHIDFCIDGDASTATGGYSGCWDQGETPSVDILCEGSLFEDATLCEAYDAGVYSWSGEVNADGWSWADVEVADFISGQGTKKAWEFRIIRELYPAGTLKKEFKMGVLCTVNGWDATGALPNAEVTEANPNGLAPLATIKAN